MTATTVRVNFKAHLSPEQMAAVISGVAIHGQVFPGLSDRDISVVVSRASHLPKLTAWLTTLERYGWVRWSTDPEISN
jgi:hypothetical protein